MFRQAIALDDGYNLAYLGLTDVFLQRENWDYDPDSKWRAEAKVLIDTLAARDSSLTELYFSLGLYYAMSGKHTQRLAAFKKLVELRPNDFYSHYILGFANLVLNDQEAERMYSICPGYRRVFSFMIGIFMVCNSVRIPSVLKDSSVPTGSKSTYSLSDSAGFVSTFPFATMRTGRI